MLRNLTFARDSWFGFDKLDHLVWSLAYWVVLTGFVPNIWLRLLLFAVAAIGVEEVQDARHRSWIRKGRPQPRPFFCDQRSYKDVVWDAAGLIVAATMLGKIAGLWLG